MRLLTLLLALSTSALAQDYDYLKRDEQKYFQNDAQDGKNQWQRIDANVREINRLHGIVAELKLEIARLKTDVEELKKKK